MQQKNLDLRLGYTLACPQMKWEAIDRFCYFSAAMGRQPQQDPAETRWNIKHKAELWHQGEFHPAE